MSTSVRATACLALLLSSCAPAPVVAPQAIVSNLKSWYELQDAYASAIASRALGENTSLVAVKDFIFPIGTPLNEESSMARTMNCSVPSSAIMNGQFATHPTITSNTSWTVFAAPHSELMKALADGRVDYQQVRQIHVAFSDLTYQLVPDVGVDEHYRRSAKCLEDIDGKMISIVRGYIYGRMRISTQDFDKGGLGAKVRKVGSMDFRYTDAGEIAIEDNERKARFVILSKAKISSACPTCRIGMAALDPNEKALAHANLAKVETTHVQTNLASSSCGPSTITGCDTSVRRDRPSDVAISHGTERTPNERSGTAHEQLRRFESEHLAMRSDPPNVSFDGRREIAAEQERASEQEAARLAARQEATRLAARQEAEGRRAAAFDSALNSSERTLTKSDVESWKGKPLFDLITAWRTAARTSQLDNGGWQHEYRNVRIQTQRCDVTFSSNRDGLVTEARVIEPCRPGGG